MRLVVTLGASVPPAAVRDWLVTATSQRDATAKDAVDGPHHDAMRRRARIGVDRHGRCAAGVGLDPDGSPGGQQRRPGRGRGIAPVSGPASTPSGFKRQEVTYVTAGSRMYLAGGKSTRQQAFDPVTHTWSNVASLPVALDHIQATALERTHLLRGRPERIPRQQLRRRLRVRPRHQQRRPPQPRSPLAGTAEPAASSRIKGRSTWPAASTPEAVSRGSTSTTRSPTPGVRCRTCPSVGTMSPPPSSPASCT